MIVSEINFFFKQFLIFSHKVLILASYFTDQCAHSFIKYIAALQLYNLKDRNSMKSVIKTNVSSSVKTRFKMLCIQNGMTISSKLERSIRDLIRTQADIPEELELSVNDYVVVKGYIPESLKRQFHALCVERGMSMTWVLRYLITTSLETDNQ